MTPVLTESTLQAVSPETEARLKAASVEERDSAIYDAHTEGASLRQIAALVGLSPTGVRKVIQRIEEQ